MFVASPGLWRTLRVVSSLCIFLSNDPLHAVVESSVLKPSLDVLNGIFIPKLLATQIEATDFASIVHLQRTHQANLAMQYTIFKGSSALRELAEDERAILGYTGNVPMSKSGSHLTPTAPILSKAAASLVLLCLFQRSDAAHEVILGVAFDTLDDAEYAASHPGQTTWAADHPLTDSDDMVHSILHRLCEGSLIGEGGYHGWENAAYWAAGGPKSRYTSDSERTADDTSTLHAEHPARSALALAALEHAPHCVRAGVVHGANDEPGRANEHCIIAGGGKTRTVHVPVGWWDPFCFIQLIQDCCSASSFDSDMQRELDWLQELELRLLLRHELFVTPGPQGLLAYHAR